MDPKFKHDSFDYINLDGENVGATMRLHRRSAKDCSCINIYVNNNVQGVSNSVLYESEVRMRDPGISLYFENLKVEKGTSTSNKRFCWVNRLGFLLCMLNFLALLFLLVLLFSSRLIIIVV
ncbi:hypothetical protein Fmac_006207 [Flemingia macrophylla]|uniref:Uncharacterized protein n=1 Tax=Flemingia macrophylla TaxID=520843 RepID=A0ABD1N9Z1_9FABA